MGELDLSDAFRSRNPKRKMFSYIHTQHGAKSRIDRVYTNDENVSNIFQYKHTPTIWRKAHRVVSFVLREEAKRGPGFWKLNISVIPDRAYGDLVQSTINDLLALNIPDPIERWLIFIETIRLESQVYCSRKHFIENELKILCERNLELLERNPLLGKNVQLQSQHQYYEDLLDVWTKKRIEGHRTRIKTQPRFEQCEPKIDFYASLEKKSSRKKTISHLVDAAGTTVHSQAEMASVVSDFYTDLFSPKASDHNIGSKLLGNIDKTVPPAEKESLNRSITRQELEFAVMKLRRNKSPGPDGIPAEFYQYFWHLIQDFYFEYISEVETTAFPIGKNTSITTLVFKNKGDIGSLAYYRPIALMNVDIKILTKLLSMRLVTVLPEIIHKSQTSVFGRNIGDNINLVRDIIDLVNKNDEEAALLFLDQEKAFDRVSHDFLYKVMEKFGVGDYFINWVKLIYSNASTRVNLNGFLTESIPLSCGVRQGCPLSPLLYVMVIEILALQLRANQNIVGFTINNEKLVSAHYADDTVIKITQNRCFKEVYKELNDYEKATGAKVNYEKTEGLWLGRWRGRTDDPFAGLWRDGVRRIKWVSGNVKHLGIYVGNEDPCTQTFAKIIPKVKRRLDFWKPLKLPILAKARVIEIFHASKLFYASNFYAIPPSMVQEVEHLFTNYINFPGRKNMVSRMEMEKLREFGGLKLINVQLKAETPKVKWLMRLITDENLSVQRGVFDLLMASDNLYLTGYDMIFAETSYIRRCSISNSFYLEALLAVSKLNTYKHFSDIEEEHVFHNKIFVTSADDDDSAHDLTLTPFRGSRILGHIKTYGDLLRAEATLQGKALAALRRKKASIEFIRDNVDTHLVVGYDGKEYTFASMTQKDIYSELIQYQSRDHPYAVKWITDLPERLEAMDWDKTWASVHNQFFTEETKSSIWSFIHLNFYTTYNFNSWFNRLDPCPLCRKIPDDVYHIILDCRFTKTMWRRLNGTLFAILPTPVTDHEMAFGLEEVERYRNSTILRNWITFTLRRMISQQEYICYKINQESKVMRAPACEKFFTKFNFHAKQELMEKKLRYDFQGLSDKFEKIVTVNHVIASVRNGEYVWNEIM